MAINPLGGLFSSFGAGSSSGLYGSLSELASIRRGSFRKLAMKYYGSSKVSNKTTDKKTNSTTEKVQVSRANKEKASALSDTRKKVTDLKKSTDTLKAIGLDSVFKVKDGEFDTDKILGAVKDYVNNYNAVIEDSKNSTISGIKNATDLMVKATASNSKLLAKIGITIGEDNKLSLDEETFKKADMNDAKTLFYGSGSYGSQTGVRASMIDYTAKNEMQKLSTYNGIGGYSYYNSSSYFNKFM